LAKRQVVFQSRSSLYQLLVISELQHHVCGMCVSALLSNNSSSITPHCMCLATLA